MTVLRFANFIGPRIDTVFTRYFALPVVPTVLGYDARVQLLHEEDGLAVLERATSENLPGVFNVAADGVLLLSQAIRRAGRVPLPVPTVAVGPLGRLFRGARLVDFSPEQMRLLNFGRVVDNTRLREQFGFTPRWTTTQAFDDYVRGRALSPVLDPARFAAARARRAGRGPGAAMTARRAGDRRPCGRPVSDARIIPLHPDESGGRTRWRLGDRGAAAPARRRRSAAAGRPTSGAAAGTSGEPAAGGAAGRTWEQALAELLAFLRRRAGRRLRGRRLRLRHRPHRQRAAARAAPALPALVPGGDDRHAPRAGRPAARWWWPTTPARCRWTR